VHSFSPTRETRIDYDVPVPPERIAFRLPEGARVVDRDEAFASLYPLEKAIMRCELGDLIFAIHDLRPIKDHDGLYVVSSVRGTPEYLKRFTPRRRWINVELSVLDVAYQMTTNRMLSGKYDQIGMGTASREGVEYAWWMVIPRKFYKVESGKVVYLPRDDKSWMPGVPGRLENPSGTVWVPLSATYWDERRRTAQGALESVSQWVEVPLPADKPLTTFEDAAARARHDVLFMGSGGLLAVAADTKADASGCRPLSHFEPDRVTDVDYAAAVLRGINDLRRFDEVREPGPEIVPPLPGTDRPLPR
jgi:hypothetical protein